MLHPWGNLAAFQNRASFLLTNHLPTPPLQLAAAASVLSWRSAGPLPRLLCARAFLHVSQPQLLHHIARIEQHPNSRSLPAVLPQDGRVQRACTSSIIDPARHQPATCTTTITTTCSLSSIALQQLLLCVQAQQHSRLCPLQLPGCAELYCRPGAKRQQGQLHCAAF